MSRVKQSSRSANASRTKSASRRRQSKPVRLGVVGLGRGQTFMTEAAKNLGFELVALCDTWEEKLREMGRKHNVTTYTDYDKFLEHDMDAVVLANYFHEHAPFAIKALNAGMHVMSETAACKTLAEGVALCRAVEKSGKQYMFAENYPYTKFNQELRRVYQSGELGEVLYAEGEYNHPLDQASRYYRRLAPTEHHWRNWLPSTYYCTHAMAPLMYITETMPVSVNALSVAWPGKPENLSLRRSDPAGIILCKMDNGSVFRLFGIWAGGHSCWYRVHGTRGAAEVQRGDGYFGTQQVRVWHEPWNCPPDQPRERAYVPEWPEHADLANAAGHGGGDFWTNFHFMRAIRGVEKPFLNVYRAVAMSVIGAQGWKSALANGQPFEIPDFTSEKDRKRYEDDHFSPFPEDADKAPNQPPPSIAGYNVPDPAHKKRYLKQAKLEQAEDLQAMRDANANAK